MYKVTVQLPDIRGLAALGPHTTVEDIEELFNSLGGRISRASLLRCGVKYKVALTATNQHMNREGGPLPLIKEAGYASLRDAKAAIDAWIEEVYSRLGCLPKQN